MAHKFGLHVGGVRVWSVAGPPVTKKYRPATLVAQVLLPAMSTQTVVITNMFNATQTIEDIDPSTSTYELKQKYKELCGHPPEKQNLWFPVPEETEGAQAASHFPWWEKSVNMKTKPQDLLDAMAKSPLKLADDDQTVGGMAALQAKSSQQDFLQFYVILNLRGRRRSSILRMEMRQSSRGRGRACCSVM